uniref:NAD-dependent epimerase/dehydratase domain-containing protein n=1 Tax=Kalanchoe fedtschenkoi TaxID=63787 RepID=A0A7N0VM29_KALFE
MGSTGEELVCVTGASGYIASWIVKLLLQRGYTVNATVRSIRDTKKIAHLLALDGADERLHLFEADLLEEGSFDSAIQGCQGVFHTASPVLVSVSDPQTELIGPAVNGTLNVLKSCSKAPSIKRIVITSSISSMIFNGKPLTPDVVIDESWYSDPVYCKETKLWYKLSKTLAEEAALKFAKEHELDLVTIHPGFVIGPPLQEALNITDSNFTKTALLPMTKASDSDFRDGVRLQIGKAGGFGEAAETVKAPKIPAFEDDD